MKLSSKDILLVLGIIVAIVVTITTIAYTDQKAYVPEVEQPAGKTSLNQTASEFIQKSLEHASEQIVHK